MAEFPKIGGVEHEILRLLTTHREMYGLEMVRASKAIKRGTVYVSLLRLEEKGWIKSRPEDKPDHPGMVRRLYSIAAPGVRALASAEAVASIAINAIAYGPDENGRRED